MNRFAILLGASTFASSAIAQQQGHPAPPAPATANACTPEHAAMGHCTLPPGPQPQAVPQQEQPVCTPEHAAMGHCSLPQPAQYTDDPHAGHDLTHTAVSPPVAPPPPEAFSGPEHAADARFGDAVMARSRRDMVRMHGGLTAYRLLIDRAELQMLRSRSGYAVDAEAWYGGDIDKLWVKAETHGRFRERFEGAQIQALWSHAIGPWFDLQTGLRYDLRRGPDRGHLVLGAQGLAPYWIEIDAAAFLSGKGDVTARFEAEHDMRITQRLILQPRGELDFSLQDIPRERIGAGLSQFALGARLRYQVTPLFAPYIGVEYGTGLGNTRRFRRAAGESPGGFGLLAGIRAWF